jgi:predicted amidohydrolase YtcJ
MTSRRFGLTPRLAACAIAGLELAAANRAFAQAADLVFVNGKVFTADARSSLAEGFAVRGDRFIAVGPSAAMQEHVGIGSRVIDLHGRFVTPGLADGHLHNEGGGPGVDLSSARSLSDLLDAVGRAAKDTTPRKPIISNNDWHEAQLREQRLPTASELDLVAPMNPVVLVRGGHEYILNSVALRLWNITKFTPAPAGGEIGKSTDGELNGELVDNARSLVTLPSAPPVGIDNVLATQRKLNAYGITSARIPGSYRGDFFQALDAMLEARKRGTLTLRLNVYLPGIGVRDLERMRAILARSPLKQDEGDEWVRVGGVKLLVDGGFEGGHMTKPFVGELGKGGTYYGITVVPAEPYTEIVKMLNAGGWRVTTHAVGDAALDEVIDAYTAANAEHSIRGRRWAIEHLFVSQEARRRALGAGSPVPGGAVTQKIPRKRTGQSDHASQDLSGSGISGGRRHGFPGRPVQSFLGVLPFSHA